MKETLVKYRFFTPDNYDKEEKFLRSMSLKGWHFESLSLVRYKFVKGQPIAYSYKLDFRKNIKEDKDNYVSMYEDFGWEHFYEFTVFGGVWEYFRKESEAGEEEALFTDNESKIELLSRIKKNYFLIFIFFIAINLINLFNIFNLIIIMGQSSVIILAIIPALVIYLYIKIQINISKKIEALKQHRPNQIPFTKHEGTN